MALLDLKAQRGITDMATRLLLPGGARKVIVHAPPTAATVADNESLTNIARASCEGIAANRLKYATGSDPTLTITIGQKSPDVIALSKKRIMETAASQSVEYFRNAMRVPDTLAPELPAEAAGVYGTELVADTPAEGAWMDDTFGTSRPLTQEDFATFDPVTMTESFAIGASGNFLFSNDLRDQNVSIDVATFTLTEIWQMTSLYSSCSMKLRAVQQNLTVVQYVFPDLVPITQDLTIEAPDQQLSFTIATPFTYKVLGRLTTCVGT
jgi:hypothetical protein